jgi:sugar lactone lactonase YvrE
MRTLELPGQFVASAVLAVLAFTAIPNAQSQGIISTVVGNGTPGYSGNGGQATAASLSYANGGAFDSNGNLYIADSGNSVIRKVTPAGIISTVAGNGRDRYSGDGGPATSAGIGDPSAIKFDALGNLYIADQAYNVIRMVTPYGLISTVVGNGNYAYNGDNIPATSASLNNPQGMAFDAAGNLYIADLGNSTIRKVTPAGIISTVAGVTGSFGYQGDGGPATSAWLNYPYDVTIDNVGNLYIADAGNNAIRKVTPAGIISTAVSGPISSGLATDNSGNIYFSDDNANNVSELSPSGIVTVVAGNGAFDYTGDGGPATAAALNYPAGVFLDQSQNLYIADSSNSVIRKVTFTNPLTVNVTAAELSVSAGAPAGTVVASLVTGFTSPNYTAQQIEALLTNAEFGVTIGGAGYSQNYPIFSYGAFVGGNVLPAVPANALSAFYSVTPYLTGPGAANFTLIDNPGSITITALSQPLTITGSNLTIYAGLPAFRKVAELMQSYLAPGITGTQLAVLFANAEVGFTVSGPGFSNNIPLFSYGTYFGTNLLAAIPAGAPYGTFTLTPYLIGPGASYFTFTPIAGTLTIADPSSRP